jgi:hypothetical protein
MSIATTRPDTIAVAIIFSMLAIRSNGIAIGTHDGECACVSRGDGFGGAFRASCNWLMCSPWAVEGQPRGRARGETPARNRWRPIIARRGPQKSPAGQTGIAAAPGTSALLIRYAKRSLLAAQIGETLHGPYGHHTRRHRRRRAHISSNWHGPRRDQSSAIVRKAREKRQRQSGGAR